MIRHSLWVTAGALMAAFIAWLLPLRSASTSSSASSITDCWHARRDPDRTMLAVAYDRHASDPAAAGLKLRAVPMPKIRPHQVLIRVKAAALNPVDFKFMRGVVPSLFLPKPKIPGLDVAGVIVEVGDQAQVYASGEDDDMTTTTTTTWRVGDRVAAMVPSLLSPWGTLAEYVAVDARLVARIPDDFAEGDDNRLDVDDYVRAASLPLVALTVVRAFKRPTDIASWDDKKVLVQAGAGGVGTLAVQYAKHVLNASVVAATASVDKAPLLKGLGADLVIDYRSTAFEDVVRDYDVVLDPMSFLYEKRTLQSNVLKPTGWYLNIPSSDWSLHNGAEVANGVSSFWNAFVSAVRNFVRPGSCPKIAVVWVASNGPQLRSVMNLVSQQKIRPVVDRVFPVEEVGAAFRYLESGRATGKVVIDMTSLQKIATS